jgi:hypothetical protein
LLVGLFLISGEGNCAFNATGWSRFREVHVPKDHPPGPVAIPIESSILEKCRPDMADLLVLSSTGEIVPHLFEPAAEIIHPEPFPARVYRIAERPGKWTDIRIDKSAKVVTEGIEFRTDSKDFLRVVELRGSDDGRDSFVVRMDGLICDIPGPVPIRSLRIQHPPNNFRYLHIRIRDEGKPALSVASVLCCPPTPRDASATPMSLRIVENRSDRATGATIVVADLGERRFPMVRLAISTPVQDFVKKAIISFARSASSDIWKRVYEGTFFRITKGPTVKENLKAEFKPQTARFVMVELRGPGKAPVEVDRMEAVATKPFVVIDFRPGLACRLLYGNPTGSAPSGGPKEISPLPHSELSASLGIRLGKEEKYIPPPLPPAGKRGLKGGKTDYNIWRPVTVVALLSCLVLLFALMLGFRLLRRTRKRGTSRLLDY